LILQQAGSNLVLEEYVCMLNPIRPGRKCQYLDSLGIEGNRLKRSIQ